MPAAISTLKEFLRLEAASGILLVATAAFAMILANSPAAFLYDALLGTPMGVRVGALAIDKPLLLWINDGLMAVFFFTVGLEIKREFVDGELSSARQAALPVIAAAGGMAVPALIYLAVNWSSPTTLGGWAIPAATDIAFALGVMSLLGPRVPASLKAFLLALAIIDDLGAIVIIALFYSGGLSVVSLAVAALGLVVLAALNLRGALRIAPYVIVGVIVWVAVLKSGVHATLAGVAVAFFIPLRPKDADGSAPASRLEHDLHPWVAFLIMPLFAFANAGVSLWGLDAGAFFGPVTLGIAAGLFIGKQLGVMAFATAAIALGIAHLPAGASRIQLYGVACLTGIGFTMSLFIGTLAFADAGQAASVRVGVLAGSIVSAVLGFAVLRWMAAPPGEDGRA
jgi:NhaA family Na+:H+ antiporter